MIILVGGFKGGVAKSTIATNLAVACERTGKDVFLVDADPVGSRTATSWLAERRRSQKAEGAPGRIAGASMEGDIEEDVLDLAKRYDVVIVDAGGRDSDEMRGGLIAADIIIAPFQPSQSDLWTVEDVAALVKRAQRFNKNLSAWAVLARTSTNPKVTAATDAEGFIQDVAAGVLTLAKSQLCDRTAYRNAIHEGKSVLEMSDAKAAAELEALAAEVLP